MKRLFASCFVFLITLHGSFALNETDPSPLRISLLTCSPGADLYAVFGHSALRIVDASAGTDIVYNYGTFDFNDPDFYTKFVRGKLNYFVSQVNYSDFLFEYQYFKRGVMEQVLHLSDAEKKTIQSYLFENIREENRYYRYDFLFDNCTTRLRDIIFKRTEKTPLEIPIIVSSGQTFRDYLHFYLNRAELKWTALGIDLLLGVNADMPMDNMESMFLPDFLFKGVSVAIGSHGKLLSNQIVLLKDNQSAPLQLPFYASPLFVVFFISMLLFILTLNFLKTPLLKSIADQILFVVTGFLGFFLLLMWVGTNHQSFSKNLNLIWAFPLNLFFAFQLNKIKKWMKHLFKIWSWLILILIAFSLTYLGMINFSLYPLMLLMSYRYWVLSKT